MIGDARTWIGVLRLDLAVPGARTLKDRRQALHSLRDRIRARFDVSCHDVTGHDLPASAALLVTTGGTDATVLRAVFDRIRSLAAGSGDVVLTDAPGEVRGWPDPTPLHGGEP